jgi:hypothetical protein
MHSIKVLRYPCRIKRQSVSHNHRVWVVLVAHDINAGNLKPGARVTHSSAASAAKQIEQARPNKRFKKDARDAPILILQAHHARAF